MSFDRSRVQRELKWITEDQQCGVEVDMKDGGSLEHLVGCIKGPVGTPYEGGFFEVDIVLPPAYPFEPPKMTFITKVWHPNVSSANGCICLDILKDQWSPALTLKTAMLSLQALLSTPEPNDPQDAQVARQYISDREAFNTTAKFWTETYAQRSSDEQKVQQLLEMGFAEPQVREALAATKGDTQAALERLFG